MTSFIVERALGTTIDVVSGQCTLYNVQCTHNHKIQRLKYFHREFIIENVISYAPLCARITSVQRTMKLF